MWRDVERVISRNRPEFIWTSDDMEDLDGIAMVLLLLRETTFDALADHPDFRYMVRHKLDSNLRIIVARNPSEV